MVTNGLVAPDTHTDTHGQDRPEVAFTKKRKIQLRNAKKLNLIRCKPPYFEIVIKSRRELLWVARLHGWKIDDGVESNTPRTAQAPSSLLDLASKLLPKRPHVDLRGAALEDIDMSGLNLGDARLDGATLDRCKMSATYLVGACLDGAKFRDTKLTEALLLNMEQENSLSQRIEDFTSHGTRIPIKSRSELLRVQYHYPEVLGALDLRSSGIYEMDIRGMDFSPESVETQRMRELLDLAKANVNQGKPPLYSLAIADWKEIYWLRHIQDSPFKDPTRPDLRGANLSQGQFSGADFQRADLRDAILTGAVLDEANLRRARLTRAKLENSHALGANLEEADLRRSQLYRANLERAEMWRANLAGAQLLETNLRSAQLGGANLCDAKLPSADLACANLQDCQVNASTSFTNTRINAATRWGDIVWVGTPFLEVNWRHAARLGDEDSLLLTEDQKNTPNRDAGFREAMRAYRQMQVKLQEQGFYSISRRFRLREKALERRQLWEHRSLKWITSATSYILLGYGEQPGKLIYLYLGVILIWGIIYYVMAHYAYMIVPGDLPYDLPVPQAVELSVTSFRGQPEFPQTLLQQHVTGFLFRVVGACETWLGTLIALAFSVLWMRRLLGNDTPVVESRERRKPNRRAHDPTSEKGG